MPLTLEQERARKVDQWPLTLTLTEVEEADTGYTLHGGSTGFGLSKEHGVTPKVDVRDALRRTGFTGTLGVVGSSLATAGLCSEEEA